MEGCPDAREDGVPLEWRKFSFRRESMRCLEKSEQENRKESWNEEKEDWAAGRSDCREQEGAVLEVKSSELLVKCR